MKMTIKEMHIGIDLGLQSINSNVFGNLQKEEKDFYINTTISEFIKAVLLDEKNTIYNLITYADIRGYFEALQAYVKSVELDINVMLSERYVYGSLPSNNSMIELSSGNLIDGVKYKVITADSIDLSDYGLASAVDGSEFVCKISNLVGAAFSLKVSGKYRILNTAGATFPGAINNTPGEVFVATGTSVVGGHASTELEVLEQSPTWETSTKIIALTDIGYYLMLVSRSAIKKNSQSISSGALVKGTKYVVDTVGTTDFSSFGGWATNDVDAIFVCDTNGTPTWQGSTILKEILTPANRLVKVQDVFQFLDHSFGSAPSSPISIMADNTLRVYYKDGYSIERLYLDYVRQPRKVDINASIDSDLPSSLHPTIVDLTIKRISAFTGNPNYPVIAEEISNDNNIK